MLWLERERLGNVGIEIGGLLPRDSVEEVERDVVKSGITEMIERGPDVVRSGNALEHFEQTRLEALRPERDTVDPVPPKQRRELARHGLGVRLDRHLCGRRQRRE